MTTWAWSSLRLGDAPRRDSPPDGQDRPGQPQPRDPSSVGVVPRNGPRNGTLWHAGSVERFQSLGVAGDVLTDVRLRRATSRRAATLVEKGADAVIFLSHSWSNKPAARRLVEALAQQRLPAWL